MNGRKHLIMLLVLTWIMAFAGAQELPFDSQAMEDLLYRNESAHIPEPASSVHPESVTFPVNLNTASQDELESSGLFTPYQMYQLMNYRDKYGLLYSIHELAALPGFHPNGIRKIESFVSLHHDPLPEREKPGQHLALINLERSYPASVDVSAYAGPLLKSSLRIRSRPRNNLALGLSYEKDAGEPFLYQKRPQFLSGFFSFEGKHFFRQLVAGNFRLNQGLGLVNGAGFMHRAADFSINRQSLSRIKAHASLNESSSEQGIACRMGTAKFQWMLWASYHSFSISPSAIKKHPEAGQWIEYQNTSGLFRTAKELESRDLAYRIHSGMQMLYLNKGLSVGILGGMEWVGPGKKASGLLDTIPKPGIHQTLSLHGNWYKGKVQVFGEMAFSGDPSLAFLVGSNFQFNAFITGHLLIHHYGLDYRGSLSTSYSTGSHIKNEQGVAFHLRMEGGEHVIILFTGELFRYPSPRYLVKFPSAGYRMELSLQNPTETTLQWKTRLVHKTWQTTPATDVFQIRPLKESRVNRIDGQLIFSPHDRFRWLSRLVLGYASIKEISSPDYAVVQQLTLQSDHFRVTAQMVLFHVSDWSNRIYLYEPGFYYSFSFPVYYGSGQKTTLLLSINPVKELTVSLKISETTNKGKQSWISGIQLRIRL